MRAWTSGGWLGWAWGTGGVLLILSSAVLRLAPVAWSALVSGLRWWQLGLFAASVGFMAYSEGYRGFQRGFSPRVVARALQLAENPRPLFVLMAPLYCMGFFHATRKRMLVSWCLTAAIVGMVIMVKGLPQPWRGIIDAGVVVGLVWGMVALVFFARLGLAGAPLPVPADLPEGVRGSSI